MKFIADHSTTQDSLDQWAQGGEIESSSFYFWNSGDEEQRSQRGLLRSLLYEVLRNRTDQIPKIFPDEFQRQQRLAKHDVPAKMEDWTMLKLKTAFERLLEQLSQNMRLCFFIDGLDEFDGDHGEIASYLVEHSYNPNVKFCISSRPWTVFKGTFKGKPQIKLQDLTRNDIEGYIRDRLRSDRRALLLTQEHPEESRDLVDTLIRKADGVFLWIYLVVRSLLQGLTNGDGIKHLQRRLDELPDDLHSLYNRMLTFVEPVYS
jgi:hypothetical protein